MVPEFVLLHGEQDDRASTNLTVNVIITVLLFVLVNKATSIMVAELSQAHAEF